MALRNLEVVVVLVDKASKQLKDVENNVKKTGKAARDSGADFTKFTRTLFTAAATVGLFSKSISTLFSSLEAGGQYDRLILQYERVFGDKGALFSSIDRFTDAAIDREEALRSALTLGNLHLVNNAETAAKVISMGGAAARRAGKDTSEGVKEITEFMQDFEISHLQNLGLIRKTDESFKLVQTFISKYSGALGGVIAPQVRFREGMALINKLTHGMMTGFRDGADTVKDFRSNLTLLKDNIGRLLITALAPVVSALTKIVIKIVDFIDKTRKTNRGILDLVKYGIIAATTVMALSTALGVLRLSVIALNSLGVGIPRLNAGLLLAGALFFSLTAKVKPLSEKFEVLGKFVTGIVELISSFDEKTGKSKIGANLKKQLEEAGIYKFALVIAKIGIIIERTAKDIVAAFTWANDKITSLFESLGFAFQKVIGDNFSKPWANFWVNSGLNPVQKFVRTAMVVLGGLATWWAGKKLFGGLNSVLSRIPVIGKLFGGGRKPSGTPNDPIYVRGAGFGLGGVSFGGKGEGWSLPILLRLVPIIISGLVTALTVAVGAAIGVAAGMGINYLLDKYTKGETKEGYKGDILEQGLFKASKLVGGMGSKFAKEQEQVRAFRAKSDVQLINELRKSQGKSPLTKEEESRLTTPNLGTTGALTTPTPKMASVPASYNQQIEALETLGATLGGIHTSQRDEMRKSVEAGLNNGLNTQDVVNASVMNKDAVDALYQSNAYLKNISEHFRTKSSQMNPNVKNYMESSGIK